MAWATLEQLEDWIGLPRDTRMSDALAISDSYCKRQRPDLDPTAAPAAIGDPPGPGDQYVTVVGYDGVISTIPVASAPPGSPITIAPTITQAVILYAAQLYRVRATPRGIAGYESEGDAFDTSTEYYRFRDLLGIRKPVAR